MIKFNVTKRVNVHVEKGCEYALLSTVEHTVAPNNTWCLYTWEDEPSKEEVDNQIANLLHAMRFALTETTIIHPLTNHRSNSPCSETSYYHEAELSSHSQRAE